MRKFIVFIHSYSLRLDEYHKVFSKDNCEVSPHISTINVICLLFFKMFRGFMCDCADYFQPFG